MPTTVQSTPFSVTFLPTSEGSAPKRRRQSPSLTIATGALPGLSSPSRKARPTTGWMPSSGISEGLIRLPVNCSGSPCPLRLNDENDTAPSRSKVCVCSDQER